MVVCSVFGGGSLVLVKGAWNREIVFNVPDAKEFVAEVLKAPVLFVGVRKIDRRSLGLGCLAVFSMSFQY